MASPTPCILSGSCYSMSGPLSLNPLYCRCSLWVHRQQPLPPPLSAKPPFLSLMLPLVQVLLGSIANSHCQHPCVSTANQIMQDPDFNMYEGLPDLLDVGNPCMDGLGGDPLLEYFGGDDSPSGGLLGSPSGGFRGAFLAHDACLKAQAVISSTQAVPLALPQVSCMVQAPVPSACLCDHLVGSLATPAILQAFAAC